jgi:hypothetical protein
MDAKELAAIGGEIEKFTTAVTGKMSETDARLLVIEQKMTAPRGGSAFGNDDNDIAQTVINSESFKSFVGTNKRRSDVSQSAVSTRRQRS